MKQTRGIISLRKKIAVGYALIIVLIGGIIYTYMNEWRQLEALDTETCHIRSLRQSVHEMYVRMVKLSLIGETVMEWDTIHSKQYHIQRLEIDTLLCGFKNIYPHQRIESLRRLLADKEEQLNRIVEIMERQDETHELIARQIPAITRKIIQQPEKKKRGGFLGLFKKKVSDNTITAPAAMLRSLNNNVIARQQKQSLQLEGYVDSLTIRNNTLNLKLQELINQMDTKVQNDLQQREQAISATRERGYLLIGGLTVFVLVLLVLSYIIICKYVSRIRRYKAETESLIRKLEHSVQENKDLLLARRKIMFTVTHELRTLLTAISGYAELIAGGTDTTRYGDYAQTIRQASTHMVSLLNTLLNFFRLDCGKEEAHSSLFRLQDIAEILKAEFLPQAQNKGIGLNVTSCEDAVAFGDKERILQIGNNLLSNALKFTQKGAVALKTEYDSKVLTLMVSDTGTGISREQQQQIFIPFERLPNAATEDGFGLGLSIVLNLVKLLDGTIDLYSTPGEGSTFTVRLPIPLGEKSLQGKEMRVEKEAVRPFSVLVLDNDEVLLAMTGEMFARHGIFCHACRQVNDLMENIRTKNYDLLITDLKMPEMSGFDVLELLRTSRIGNSQEIPVILATASGACTEEEVQVAGFAALLGKPFSSTELLEIARRCTDNLRQEEEPDFSSLLEFGNPVKMLDKLIEETEKDMRQVAFVAGRNDRKALDEWVHHLRSSWAVIHADKPLWDLYTLLHAASTPSEDKFREAVEAVLAKGKVIMQAAQRRKEAEEWQG